MLGQIWRSPYNWLVLNDEGKQWISEGFEKVRAEFSERLEKIETTMLTEFHKGTSPVELRQRSRAAVLRAIDTENWVTVGSAEESRRASIRSLVN